MVALAVLVFVAYTGLRIVRQSVGILADSVRVSPAKVREVLAAMPAVLGARAIRSRGLEGSVYLDLVIHVAPTMDLRAAHQVADEVEQRLTSAFSEIIDVVVHVEPAAA